MIGQVFIFLRHGVIPIRAEAPTRGLAPLKRRALSPQGRREALAAGRYLATWLERHNRVIDRILVAPSQRAEETAALALDAATPRVRLRLRPEQIVAQIDTWFSGQGPAATIARAGHGPALLELVRALAPGCPDLTRRFGVVVIFTRDAAGAPWRLTALGPPEDDAEPA